jgi:hypothetical protein
MTATITTNRAVRLHLTVSVKTASAARLDPDGVP